MNAPLRLDGTAPMLTVGEGVTDAELGAFLACMPGAAPFHSAAWGRAVEAATGHRWHPLVARDSGGGIVGILPLHHVRSRLFGSGLVSCGFAVDGGILSTDPAVTDALASAGIALARNLGLGTIELRGGSTPAGWASDSATRVGFVRSLAASRDAELAAIPRKHRAEVRKSLSNDLSVSIGRDEIDRRTHYQVYATSVRNLGTPVFPRGLFDTVLDAFGENADILTIRAAGSPVASVLSLYWQGSVMPYWGGGTRAARALRANERMYFELMDHARNRGMTRFDFGRSKVSSGPAAYKKNWGFEPSPLTYLRWTAEAKTSREYNTDTDKYRGLSDVWQRLPLWLANRVGPMIARQIG